MSEPSDTHSISRRGLLFASAGTVLGLGVFRWFTVTREGPVLSAVRDYLDGYTLDEEGLQRFAVDYTSAEAEMTRNWRWRVLAVLYPLYGRTSYFGPRPLADYAKYRTEEVIHAYLMSTDILDSPGDRSRTVQYLGLYDLYERPCTNRMARFGEDDDEPAPKVALSEGQQIFEKFTCDACHSTDGTNTVGPSLEGVGRHDDAYLRESLLDPQAKITPGYDRFQMQSYERIMTEQQLSALLEYLKTL